METTKEVKINCYANVKMHSLRNMSTGSRRREVSKSWNRLIHDHKQLRGQATEKLPALLEAVRGKGLCISLLLDPSTCIHDPKALKKEDLLKKVEELKTRLKMTEEDARQLEI